MKRFDNPSDIPDCHREWWDLCCSVSKYVAIAAPRGHAKSTAITHAYVLANALFRVSPYTVIVSDTETQAIQFLNDIRMELTDNDDLNVLFGIKKFIKLTETDIVVQCEDGYMFKIVAKGSGGSLRGIKWNGMRPKLIVCDDMENDELVMNTDRREKFFKWIYGALIPTMAPDGKMRVVGTILHLDSFLERCLPKDFEKTSIRDGLRVYTNRKEMWKGVRYEAHNDDFTLILWKERFSKETLKEKQREYAEKGITDQYNQEYRNRPIDPARAYFKRRDFVPMSQEEIDANSIRKLPLIYYVGVDLAISEKERADWSVFVVHGMDEHGTLYMVDEYRDRMDGREIVDLFFTLEQKYRPAFFAVEAEKIEKAIGSFLYEEMPKRNLFPDIITIVPSKDLQTRARSYQGRHRANYIKYDKSAEWYPEFEEELCTFPRGIKDDRVAACATLGMALERMVEAPTKQETLDEEYSMFVAANEGDFMGRSGVTGY